MDTRDWAALGTYHEATKHSVASVQHDAHRLDFAIMPRPFKVYPEATSTPLPRDFTTCAVPALEALAAPARGSGTGPRMDRQLLARLLHFTAGVLRHRTYPGGEIFFRAAACTGALYHIDLYLIAGPLADLDAGVYHFGPHDSALHLLRAGDHRAVVQDATADAPGIADAPLVLAFASTFWRNAWKYRTRAYRHAFWDSGTLLANLFAVGTAAQVPMHLVLGFVDEEMNRLLDLDGAREATLGLVALGCEGPPPVPSPPVTRLDLPTLPLSSREIAYPAIADAHAASSLAAEDEVRAWRGTLPARAIATATGPAVPLTPLPLHAVPEPIETVILRRGSTRRFGHAPIRFDQLSTLLAASIRGTPADCLAPEAPAADVYVLAHAVDGLDAGAYVLDRRQDALTLLRAGTFRDQARHLGLGQDLPADAAACFFWLTDLRPVLGRFGNRGYRVAQLEAALEAGKTYLAAYALGLGATGLTFFDDDVTAFFSPHAADKSAMFLMAFGHRASRTR